MTSLIGINGHIGVGKDTVGEVIRYLMAKYIGRLNPQNAFVPRVQYTESNWEIKKFAGKLKLIASIMTGIPVEKFEYQEFKKKFLGTEWNRQLLKITSVVEENSMRDDSRIVDTRMTVREFLQKLGTEAIRNGLHTNAWVNATFADYHPVKKFQTKEAYLLNNPGYKFSEGTDSICWDEYPKWILTDCRFPNEAQAIKDRGGIVIRVNRNYPMDVFTDTHLHPSETSLDNWNFDWVITNDSSLQDLIIKVKVMLEHFGILTPEVVNN